MSLFYIRFIFLLLILFNYASGLTKLPLCQCECCPGEQCHTQLLIFSTDKCTETTCSFEQCYKMYPKKCGLIPGFTNASCSIVNNTKSNLPDVTISLLPNCTSSNVILPTMININILFYFFLKYL